MSSILADPVAAPPAAKMGPREPGVVQTRRRSRTLPGSTPTQSDSEASAANSFASIRNLPPSHPFANPLPPKSFTGSTPCLVAVEKVSPSKMGSCRQPRPLPKPDAGSPSPSRKDSPAQISRTPATPNQNSPWTPRRTPSVQVHSMSYRSTTPTPPPPSLSPPPPPRSAQRPPPLRLLSDGDTRMARYGNKVMVKEITSFSEQGHSSGPHEVMLSAQSTEYPGRSPVFSPPRPRQFPDRITPDRSTSEQTVLERNTPPRSSSKTWTSAKGPLPRPPRAKTSSPVDRPPFPALDTHPLLFRASSLSQQHHGSVVMSSPSSNQSHLSQIQPSIQSHTAGDDLESPLSRGASSSGTRFGDLSTVEETAKPPAPLKPASDELDVFSVPPAAKVVGDEPFDLFASPTAERIRKATDCKVLDQLGNEFTFGSLLPQLTWPPPIAGTPRPRVLVVFLRHYLCGLCQDYVVSVEKALDVKALAAANVRLIFIGTGNYRVIKSYQKTLKSTVPYYVDPTPNNALYRLLGMTLEAKFVQPRTPRPDYNSSGPRLQVARGLLKSLAHCPQGASNLRDWKQQGGEFLFGPGYMCEFAHRMHHMGDHWDPGFILQAAGVPYPSAAPPPLFDPCFNPGFIISNPVTRAKVDAYLSFHHYYKSKAVGQDRQPTAPLEREKLENLNQQPALRHASRPPFSESSSFATDSPSPGSYRSTSPFRSPRQPRFLTVDSPAGTWAHEPVTPHHAPPHLTSCY